MTLEGVSDLPETGVKVRRGGQGFLLFQFERFLCLVLVLLVLLLVLLVLLVLLLRSLPIVSYTHTRAHAHTISLTHRSSSQLAQSTSS